jgi:ribosomal protein S18 acetylase RimI-like enzyme
VESTQPRIRPFDDRDAEAVVDLSLRAWAPVFASLKRALGSEIFSRLHPDWREDQRRAVEYVCAAKKGRVWVADVGASAVGFVAVDLDHPERSMGEISMLAVDPDHQGGGIGTALTEFALDRLKEAGGRPRARRGAPHLRECRLRTPADSQVLQEPVTERQLELALSYYEVYPREIDEALEENARSPEECHEISPAVIPSPEAHG